MTKDFADRAIDASAAAADAVARAAVTAQEAGDRLKSQGEELRDNLRAVSSTFSSAIDKSVAEQPMTTLGLAVAAGFILGALWKA